MLLTLTAVAGTTIAFQASAATFRQLSLFPPPPPPPASEPPPVPAPTPTPEPDPEPDPFVPSEQGDVARCFGAAAADRQNPCENPDLDFQVVPVPSAARAAQKYQTCTRTELTPLFKACFWGAPESKATRTVALIGDSHASHWRAAMQTVVAAKGWRGVSIQRAACPLTTAYPDLPDPVRETDCVRWNRSVQRWLLDHPQIDTVFTSAHLGRVKARTGEAMRETQRAGYADAFLKLLRGAVRHVVVIRGTPRISGTTIPCIEQALAERILTPAQACALRRSYALRPDPVVQAAQALATPAVQVANLASFMCDASVCNPVVGGVLVLRDVSHMTTTFSATLGPYLLKSVNRLSADWTAPARR